MTEIVDIGAGASSPVELHEIDLTHVEPERAERTEWETVVVSSPAGEQVIVDLTRLTRSQLSRFHERFGKPFPESLEGITGLSDLLDQVAFAAFLSSNRLYPADWFTEEWMQENLEVQTAMAIAESMQKKMEALPR